MPEVLDSAVRLSALRPQQPALVVRAGGEVRLLGRVGEIFFRLQAAASPCKGDAEFQSDAVPELKLDHRRSSQEIEIPLNRPLRVPFPQVEACNTEKCPNVRLVVRSRRHRVEAAARPNEVAELRQRLSLENGDAAMIVGLRTGSISRP